jgi:protein-S-isoprenylcysteine O-methyltransferase Ste14
MLTPHSAERSPGRRIAEGALSLLAFFVILEPVWMLLPFAGFLYGSGLQIENLGRNPATAWLTHFVFPVGTLGWFGPGLVLAGLALFVIGAVQIYSAKIRKSGLVTTKLYRWVRHPQYIALTLLGVGLLLAWGRAIMFVAFFGMMFLYYHLARGEERNCRRVFGEAYERYAAVTSFVIPGDIALRPLGERLANLNLPSAVRILGSLVLTALVCFGLMWFINTVKASACTVPYMTATVAYEVPESLSGKPDLPMETGQAGNVPFVQSGRVAVLRGPYPNGAAPGFAERVIQRLRQSEALKKTLAYLNEPEGDAAIIFCIPHEPREQPGKPGELKGEDGRRGPPPDPAGPDRVRLLIMRCTLARGAGLGEALTDTAKRKLLGGCFAPVDMANPAGAEICDGPVFTPGPAFPAEERWSMLMQQFAQRPAAAKTANTVTVQGSAIGTRLVMVQAPIMRTRIDPDFAREVLSRLVNSPAFRKRLRDSGAGGHVVPVVFPRPGANWYSEHHGTPQVSAFVVLARVKAADAPVEDLFRKSERELLGAFIAEMDFAVALPGDSIVEMSVVGPQRDLEERWAFFLSGVGGTNR